MTRALVTGANRGLGLAIAKGLADKGYEVLLGSRNFAAGQKVARQIGATALALDVADPNSIARAVEHAGPVDMLINNAGILGSGSLLKDPQDFADSMAAMVHGPYLLMHHLTPHMVAQDFGRVVNVSSGWGGGRRGGRTGLLRSGQGGIERSDGRHRPRATPYSKGQCHVSRLGAHSNGGYWCGPFS